MACKHSVFVAFASWPYFYSFFVSTTGYNHSRLLLQLNPAFSYLSYFVMPIFNVVCISSRVLEINSTCNFNYSCNGQSAALPPFMQVDLIIFLTNVNIQTTVQGFSNDFLRGPISTEFYLKSDMHDILEWRLHCDGVTQSPSTCTGDGIRKSAILQAGQNFTHIIRVGRKRNDHELIVTGLYRVCRHPSYVGWFVWSTGTQVLLCNPICLVIFPALTWTFFADRIPFEERALIEFFGSSYIEYQKRTPIGIPFVKEGTHPNFSRSRTV